MEKRAGLILIINPDFYRVPAGQCHHLFPILCATWSFGMRGRLSSMASCTLRRNQASELAAFSSVSNSETRGSRVTVLMLSLGRICSVATVLCLR